MSDNIAKSSKKSVLLWTVRILYIIIVIVMLRQTVDYVQALSFRTNFSRVYYVLSSSVMFVMMILALIAQFPYVFLDKKGKIRGNVFFFTAMIIHINDVVRNIIMSTYNGTSESISSMIETSLVAFIILCGTIVLYIVYYFLIKRLGKKNTAITSE